MQVQIGSKAICGVVYSIETINDLSHIYHFSGVQRTTPVFDNLKVGQERKF